MDEKTKIKEAVELCKNNRSYERKKNRNHAVARFRFFVADAKKGEWSVLS